MKASDLVAIAVIAAGLFWPQLKEKLPFPVPGPAPAPSPNVVVPDAAAQAAVAPVQTLLKGHPSRAVFAAYFAEFGDLIQKRPADFKTVGDLVKQHEIASDLFFDLDPNLVPGLSGAVETSLKALLGEEDKAVDQASALRATRALQWAAQ